MPSTDIQEVPAPAPVRAATDNEEWTFVRPKKSRNGRQRKPRSPEGHAFNHDNSKLKGDGPASQSPEDITTDYHRVRSQYEQDGASQALKPLAMGINPGHIDRAVCLGIGTFDPPDGGWDTKRRTFFQLSAFLDMVDIMEEGKDRGSIPCFFQEPLFTESDETFLKTLRSNVKVVESPEGFEMVDSNTFLYGVHLYRPIYAKALETAAPSVFVGTSLDIWDTVSFGHATEFLSLQNVKTIETTYQKRQFPAGDTTSFSSTSIYWRGNKEEEPKEELTPASGSLVDLSNKLSAVDINQAEDQAPAIPEGI